MIQLNYYYIYVTEECDTYLFITLPILEML